MKKRCIYCAEEIGAARVAALPDIEYCVKCASMYHNKGRVKVEPHRRAFDDDDRTMDQKLNEGAESEVREDQ